MKHETTIRFASRVLIYGVLVVALTVSACRRKPEQVCPSIAITPHATLVLAKPMATVGTYDVTVKADGKSEACTVTILSIGGAKSDGNVVAGPTTSADSTCKLVGIGGVGDDGSLGAFTTDGTPKSIHLRVAFKGDVLGDATVSPDYTPDECGFVKPQVRLP